MTATAEALVVRPTLHEKAVPSSVPAPGPWWVRPGRPIWSLPARAAITGLSVFLYTWELSRVGMGNTFYAAAVKSGTESWKAFLFGSFDPGSFITVDKPPAALWVMELSARVFGFSAWSMLLPEALAGVATVLILYHLVRLWMGDVAAVLAALAMALTPAAVLMFRYNNPDAFLTLLLVSAAWALWSAMRDARTWKLVACGSLVGLAFTTKMLQAFIVLPVFALVYLAFGPPRLARRFVQLLWAGLAVAVASGWWVALVELWPSRSRPYVGGSTGNSELNLIFGYNGFARILGSGAGPGGGGGGGGFAGSSGLLRMFNPELGGQIAWLLPLALIGLAGGLWWTRRGGRSDQGRAGFVLFGGWALVTTAVFSEAQGIFHPYYTVALAPALAALVGGGSVALWQLGRSSRWLGWVLPAGVLLTSILAAHLLARSPGYDPGLSTAIVVGGVGSCLALGAVLYGLVTARWFGIAAAALAAAVVLAGPAAYALTTVATATSGGDPLAGPSVVATGGGPGGFASGTALQGGDPPTSGTGRGFSGLGFAAGTGAASTSTTALDRYLVSHRDGATWIVAVSGSMTAAPIILATGDPVISMGGFNGSDPYPTFSAFKQLVSEGSVRYVLVESGGASGAAGGAGLAGGGALGGAPPNFAAPRGSNTGTPRAAFGGPPASGGGQRAGGQRPGFGGGANATSQAIDTWVEAHGTKVTATAYGGGAGGTLYLVTAAAVSPQAN